jgi:hypothetical protein
VKNIVGSGHQREVFEHCGWVLDLGGNVMTKL